MSTTEIFLKNLEDQIEKAREAREILATKQEARKKILFSNKRFPPDQEWKLKKLKDVTEEGDKKLKLYQEFFDKLQRGTPEQPGESQTSQDDTSEVSKEMNESLINDEVEKEPSVESDVLEDVSDLLASDSVLENKDSRYYCSNCPASFERDDKMLFHQEECLRAGSSKTNEVADYLQRKRTNEVVAASDADAGVEFVEKVTPRKTKMFEAMEVEVLKKEMQEEQFEYLRCKFCRTVPGKKERFFTTAAALKAHVEGEHEGSLGKKLTRQCPVCSYSAAPSQVTEHIRAKHSKEKLFRCSCGKKFMTFPAYSAHQKKYGHGN